MEEFDLGTFEGMSKLMTSEAAYDEQERSLLWLRAKMVADSVAEIKRLRDLVKGK